MMYNWQLYATELYKSLVQSFFIGLRYDAFALSYTLIPFTLLSLLYIFPFLRSKKQPQLPHFIYEFFCRFSFLIGVGVPAILNLVDAKYSQFSKHRLSFDLLFKSTDTAAHTDRMVLEFWDLALIALILLFLMYRLFPKFKILPLYENILPKYHRTLNVSAFSLLILFIPLGLRGGIEPLSYRYSLSQNADAALSLLRVNTFFNLMYSWQNVKNEPYNDVLPEAVKQIETQNIYAENMDYPQQNVMIFMLESCAAEYMGLYNNGEGFTPFMDSLAKSGQYFETAFANGTTSIEGFTSVMMSMPSVLNNSIGYSEYAHIQLPELGNFAKTKGYDVNYFHGGENGTMNFNKMCAKMGIRYFGLNEYPNHADYDGTWGIWDEPYFQYVAKQMTQEKRPFVTTIFSVTDHEPYVLPQQYQGKFPKGNLPVHETIAYTDFAMKQFFEYAKMQPWYENTLFIITADHTSLSIKPEYKNRQLGKWRVPMILYQPKAQYPNIQSQKIVQHCDILPTLVDYLGWEKEFHFPKMGESFFKNSSGKAFMYENGKYYFTQPNYYVELIDNEVNIRANNDKVLPNTTNYQKEMVLAKTYRQYCLEKLAKNEWNQ